jgi:hypothetical protein
MFAMSGAVAVLALLAFGLLASLAAGLYLAVRLTRRGRPDG